MKQEFEMTQQNMDDIIAINKSQMPVMKIGNVTTGMDLAERVNSYWEGLGNEMGFKHMTVEPSSKGKLFFLAEPKPIVVPKTELEKSIEEYTGTALEWTTKEVRSSLVKICIQLESAYTGDSLSISGDITKNIAFIALKEIAYKTK